MALSNTAVPKYYGMFRDAVIRGEIPVCKEISMEMNRVDDLIANPGIYYDDQAVEGSQRWERSIGLYFVMFQKMNWLLLNYSRILNI